MADQAKAWAAKPRGLRISLQHMAPKLVSAAMLLLAFGFAVTAANAQFTVINTDDDGPGSLRNAIQNANNNLGPDQIHFNIPGAGPHVIQPITALPAISESVVIDGYTQPGSSVNNQQVGSNAVIQIVLDGSVAQTFEAALQLEGLGSTVKGLSLIEWNSIIALNGGGGHTVMGNWIGFQPDGASEPERFTGISVDAQNCQVGSSDLADRNLIGNKTFGISIGEGGNGAIVQNNSIGTDPSGIARASNGVSINILGVEDIQIGGTGLGEGNVIAFSKGNGVHVMPAARRVTIRGNSIFANRYLGIELRGDQGVDENDPAPDADTGANGLQNYPVLVSATAAGGTRVTGSLESTANMTFDIDFYSSAISDNGPADTDGNFHGEGQSYIGSVQVTTDGNGEADIDTTVFGALVGPRISATATDPEGNTSEFSITINIPGERKTVTNTEQSGAGSFAEKLEQVAGNGNNDSAVDQIVFDTPGGVIDFNVIGNPFSSNIEVDFSTQPGFQAPTPGIGPCENDGVYPVIVDTGVFDLNLANGNSIIGLNLIGSLRIAPDVVGVDMVNSVTAPSFSRAAAVVEGDFNGIRNTELHGNGDVPAVTISGSYNRFSQVCFDGALQGVSIGSFPPVDANWNTFVDSVVPSESQIAFSVVSGTGNTISRTIFGGTVPSAFGLVAFDLRGDGHTSNDLFDLDEGPNDLQNHQVIGASWASEPPGGGSSTWVSGTLDSEPSRTYTLEFFASPACSPDDYGPPGRFLDSTEVSTDSTGFATFLANLSAATTPGEVMVGSATGPSGSTSELSQCIDINQDPPPTIYADGFESGDTSAWSGTQ